MEDNQEQWSPEVSLPTGFENIQLATSRQPPGRPAGKADWAGAGSGAGRWDATGGLQRQPPSMTASSNILFIMALHLVFSATESVGGVFN